MSTAKRSGATVPNDDHPHGTIRRVAIISAVVLVTSAPFVPAQSSLVFRTLAGGSRGIADGTGSDARFYGPSGVAVDSAGVVYVADTSNHTIRRVMSAGLVTTLAGIPRTAGSTDGAGSDARFWSPSGVAVDSNGVVYVADTGNHTIRRVTPAGVVTTLAGLAGTAGSADGTGTDARFYLPSGVTVDSAGVVYVADTGNDTIRRVTPAGVVTTLAGLANSCGNVDGTGSEARLCLPEDVAVDREGVVFVADTYQNTIRRVTPDGVVTTLAALHHELGGVAVDGAGLVYAAVAAESRHAGICLNCYHMILTVTPSGVVATLAGGYGPCSTFCFPRGLAVDSAGSIYVANAGSAVIQQGAVDVPPPEPPGDLSVESVVGHTVTLRWNAPASGAVPSGYELEAGITPGGVLAALPTGSRSLIYTVSAPTGVFYARLRTLADGLRSDPSNEVRVVVNVAEAPSPPADLTAAVDSASVSLAWRNTYHGGAATTLLLDVTGAITTSLPLGLTESARFSAVPSGTYTLAVRATNSGGSSGASSAVAVTVPGVCAHAPLPPADLLAYKVGRVLSLVWDSPVSGDAPTNYVVQVVQPLVLSVPTSNRSISATVPSGEYALSVQATNACGASPLAPLQVISVP